jgi:hypothetical protein
MIDLLYFAYFERLIAALFFVLELPALTFDGGVNWPETALMMCPARGIGLGRRIQSSWQGSCQAIFPWCYAQTSQSVFKQHKTQFCRVFGCIRRYSQSDSSWTWYPDCGLQGF